MIAQNLPLAASGLFLPEAPGRPLVFADHVLMTGTTETPWSLPEHEAGMGLLLMRSGTGVFSINGQRETLRPGQYLLINRGSRLAVTLPYPAAQPLFLFFHTALADEVEAKKGVDWRWLERVHPLSLPLRQRLDWLVTRGDTCSSFGSLRADSLIRGIFDELFIEARAAAAISEDLPVTRQATRVQLFKRLDLAREWIIANYAAPITLDEMARVAALNTQHFLRMFRDCYGKTPHRFLTETRLEAARQLLLHSGESVVAVCRQTGFESPSSFSGLFKQRFGRPPAAYRKNRPPPVSSGRDDIH
ncbi:MAG TPA: AraC family transcriptional regulator [Puia sp.]|jgi:AraC-like DNA-binding protein|nr:AraC family transcriptional regulator [Puia sp.]